MDFLWKVLGVLTPVLMNSFLVSMVLYGVAVFGYDFICPDRSHLRIYSKAACTNPEYFTCLKDALVDTYNKSCYVSRPLAMGYKYVYRPGYDREKCVPSRFQPFIFYRNQQTDCYYIKSSCSEEGQIMYSPGSTTSDVQCKCDEKNGFTFIAQPRNKTFCTPTKEDCSCYRKPRPSEGYNGHLNTSRSNLTRSIIESSKCFPKVSQVKDVKETAFSYKTNAIIIVGVILFLIIGLALYITWIQLIDDDKELYPSAIYRMDEESQKLYKKALESGYEIKREIRVLVVGKKDAGKTCLVRRLRSKQLDDVTPTNGIEIHSVICKDDKQNDLSWKEMKQTADSRLLTCTLLAEKGTHIGVNDVENERLQQSDKKHIYLIQSGTKQTEKVKPSADKRTEELDVVSEGIIQSESKQSEKTTTDVKSNTEESRVGNKRSGKLIQIGSTHTEKATNFARIYAEGSRLQTERCGKSENNFGHLIKSGKTEKDKAKEDIEDMTRAKKNDEGDIRISVWDFGGDEEFYFTHQLFLAEDVVYLIVTSLNPSNESSDKFELQFWFDTVHCMCKDREEKKLNPRCIVIGTKIDLCQNNKAADDVLKEKLRSVPDALRKHIHKLFLISNKKSYDTVISEIKKAIINAAIEGTQWEAKHPLKFILLDKALDKQRNKLEKRPPIITHSEIQYINGGLEQPLTSEELELYLRYNNIAGHLIYYEDIPDYIVIDPQWLSDLFRCIVTADKFHSALPQHNLEKLRYSGQITEILLEDMFQLKKIEGEFRPYLMKVLEKFHIVIQVSRSLGETNSPGDKAKEFFAPCMVRDKSYDVTKFTKIKDKSTWLCLVFDFLPPFLFNYIIISFYEQHPFAKEQDGLPMLFSEGAVFDISPTKCEKLVILKQRNNIMLQIMMFDSAQSRRQYGDIKNLLTQIMEKLTKIFSMTIKYKYKWKCPENSNNCSGLFGFDVCRDGEVYYCEACTNRHIFQNYWGEDTQLKHLYGNASTLNNEGLIGFDMEELTKKYNGDFSATVVAIDYGTTYSGIAFSLKKENAEIYAKKWKDLSGKEQESDKTPTTILLNANKEFEAFGYEAEDRYEQLCYNNEHSKHYYFRHFKMRLHTSKGLTRSTVIEDILGNTIPALEVFSMAITYLKREAEKALMEHGFNKDNVSWVLTVPAIWDDAAKQFMREAAEKAFIPRRRLTIALEPEVASVYIGCQRFDKSRATFAQEQQLRFLVVDIGGGTADLTVMETAEEGKLKQISIASGGPCGGEEINNGLLSRIKYLVGADIVDYFRQNHTCEYNQLLSDVEFAKRTWRKGQMLKLTLPACFIECFESTTNKILKNHIIETSKGVSFNKSNRLVFDPDVACEIINSVIDIIIGHSKAILETSINVSYMVIVGGFAENDVLQERFKKEFRGLTVIIPPQAGLAVLKGAVLYGHDPSCVIMRTCDRTYGIQVYRAFLDGVDHDDKLVNEQGQLYCKDVFDILAEIGERILINETRPREISPLDKGMSAMSIKLYGSTEKSPKYVTDPSCTLLGEIVVDIPEDWRTVDESVIVSMTFGHTEITVEGRSKHSKKIVVTKLNFPKD